MRIRPIVFFLIAICSTLSSWAASPPPQGESEEQPTQDRTCPDGDSDILSTPYEGEGGEIHISKECASVLLVIGGAGGVAIAKIATPLLLAVAGFTSTGIAGGSFAAWWQSTMAGGIGAGSTFAMLQSAAMGGVGTSVTMSGAALGLGAGLSRLRQFCHCVDCNRESKIVLFSVDAVEKGHHVKTGLEEKFIPIIEEAWEKSKPTIQDVKRKANAFYEYAGIEEARETARPAIEDLKRKADAFYEFAGTETKPAIEKMKRKAIAFYEYAGHVFLG